MIIRIGNLIVKDLIQFRRDRMLSVFVLLAPALKLILMAQNVERGATEQPVAILDQDHGRLSHQLVVDLDNTEELKVVHHVQSMEQVRSLMDQGDARLAGVIPAGFSQELTGFHSALRKVRSVTPTRVGVIADGTNTLAASRTLDAATDAVGRLIADLATNSGLVSAEAVGFRTDIRFNPTMDLRGFSIPAQLGFITYQVTLALASLGLARERELGTLEQLMVTPFRHPKLASGKGIPTVALGSPNFAIMWAISVLVFQVPMNGSVLLLAALTLLFVATVVSWDMVISAISRTQQQAILFVFILAMIEIAFSGFMLPVKNMPSLLQSFSRFAPLQHNWASSAALCSKGPGCRSCGPK